MSTRYNFADSAPAISTAVDALWTYTSEVSRRSLSNPKGSTTITSGTQIGPWTTTNLAVDTQLISDPIGAQTISGTVKGWMQQFEVAGTDNVLSMIGLRVVSNDGSVVRGTLLAVSSAYGTAAELNTSQRNIQLANGATLVSVDAQNNDRIVLEVGYTDVAGTTPEARARWGESVADCAENETETASRSGWLEFSMTIAGPSAGGVTLPQLERGIRGLNRGVAMGVR